jgi:hypothetical protein
MLLTSSVPPLQQQVGSATFTVYNQGVDLMRAKKFAAAQIKFEQAIRDYETPRSDRLDGLGSFDAD